MKRVIIFIMESKRQSQHRKHSDSPPPKKFNAVHASSKKVMMTFFFDCKEPLLIEFLKPGPIVISQRYMETLQKMKFAIKYKGSRMMKGRIILLHEHSSPHVAHVISITLQVSLVNPYITIIQCRCLSHAIFIFWNLEERHSWQSICFVRKSARLGAIMFP